MGACAFDRGSGVGHVARDQCALGAAHAQAPGDGAGVDARDAGHAVLGHEIGQALLRAPVGHTRGQVAHHEASAKRMDRFVVLQIDADIADLGRGHHHNLAAV
jgi:hypothetical protein